MSGPTPDGTWREVLGHEGLYEVSDQGLVRSVDRIVFRSDGMTVRRAGIRLKVSVSMSGYPYVCLSRQGVERRYRVHRLVLEAFIGPRPAGMECCHGDGNQGNCRLSNLRWATQQENLEDALRHGRRRGGLPA